MNSAADGANVRFPPPLLYLGALILGIFLDRQLGLPRLGLGQAIREAVGILLAVGGGFVMLWAAQLFRRFGTAIIPYKPATKLVTSGAYSFTRNPMYLGMALVYAGAAIFLDSILALAFLAIVLVIIQTQVIVKEETYLKRAFGDEYLAYQGRVRRWI